MYRFVLTFLLIQFLFHLTNAKCPGGMISSFSDNTTCFLFVPQKQAFLPAEIYCNQNNGHLVSIHDVFDNVLIREEAQKNFTSDDFWIGLNSLETSGFSWIDGTPVNFVDWDKGQPQNGPNYNCGAVKLQGGVWGADDCDKLKPSVCIIKTSSLVTTTTVIPAKTTIKSKTCPPSWVYYDVTGFCYLVVSKNSTWSNAEDWCFSQGNGSHLVSIHSQAENTFVTNLISFDPNDHLCDAKQGVFIGLYTVTNETTWRWSDDTPFDYAAWPAGLPSHAPNLFCGFIRNGPPCGAPAETWANWYCEQIYPHFICKKSLI